MVTQSLRKSRRAVADARESFLASPREAADSVRGLVREPILNSWSRSLGHRVDQARIDLPRRDPDLAGPLVHAAEPVLNELRENLHQDNASIILTDADGVVLLRLCTDGGLARHLDGVQLAQGYSYAEQFVGTNGIGTALESLAPTLVHGREHFAESLGRLACAGVPVRHPVRGNVVGLLDITTWADVDGGLLMGLAHSTARRIQQNLFAHSGTSEIALLNEYLRACQHTGGPVLAVGPEILMMNDRARAAFDSGDQSALIVRASDALDTDRPVTLLAELPSGTSARLHYHPAFSDGRLVGGVLRISASDTRGPGSATPSSRPPRRLPGLVGSSSIWRHCCDQVESRFLNHESVVLRGEDGTGKTALLRAVHQAHDASGHLRIIEPPEPEHAEPWLEAVRSELEGDGTLVIRHIERLPASAVDELGALLHEHWGQADIGSGTYVAVTMSQQEHDPEIDTVLLPHFMHTIEVPPLRHHIDDIRELAPHLLARLGKEGAPTLSAAAMRQLLCVPWPGNVAQLRRVLLQVLQRHRTGEVAVDDLPPECRSAARHQLTQIESLERDAIIDALVASGGDKAKAGRELGMSRATIYRRIRRYGITI